MLCAVLCAVTIVETGYSCVLCCAVTTMIKKHDNNRGLGWVLFFVLILWRVGGMGGLFGACIMIAFDRREDDEMMTA